jgi:hypothetical protein
MKTMHKLLVLTLAAPLLSACGGSVTHREIAGGAGVPVGLKYSGVTLAIAPEAQAKFADNPKFSSDRLKRALERGLAVQSLLAPKPEPVVAPIATAPPPAEASPAAAPAATPAAMPAVATPASGAMPAAAAMPVSLVTTAAATPVTPVAEAAPVAMAAPALPPPAPTLDVVLTDVRVRGTFTAIFWGVLAGPDHIDGTVNLKAPDGHVISAFDVSATYGLGGTAGGQDEARVGWLTEKFSQLVMDELTGKAKPEPAPAATTGKKRKKY